VRKLAAEASALAKKAISAPEPQAADEKEAWKARVTYAKDIEVQIEYALFATALQTTGEAQMELFLALEQQNPRSKYINEDALAVLLESAARRNQPDRMIAYANRLIAAAGAAQKPDNVAADAWQRKKNLLLGQGYYYLGVVSGQRNKYADADKNLRLALPLIAGNNAQLGAAYFYLGVANYNLGKMINDRKKVMDGSRYSDESAKIQGPFQQQAWKNAQVMRNEANLMR